MKPVAIFAATRWELRALNRVFPTQQIATIGGVRCLIGSLSGQVYWLVQTGVGPEAAGRIAAAVLDAQPMALAISAGFACALVPAEVGSLLVGQAAASVRREAGWALQNDMTPCDERASSHALAAARQGGIPARRGTILSAPMVIWRAQDKQELFRMSGGVGLDMESAALGSAAARRGVPFAVVRTASDLVDEDLPLDFNLFLRPTGWLKGVQALLAHPSSFVGLNRLRKQSLVAAEQLAALYEAWAAGGFGLREPR